MIIVLIATQIIFSTTLLSTALLLKETTTCYNETVKSIHLLVKTGGKSIAAE